MKRKYQIIALAISLIFPSFAFSQNMEDILSRHFQATNQNKLLSVNTIRTKGKIIQMDIEFPMTQIHKRPDKSYLELELQDMKIIQAFDGENGWVVEPWSGSSVARDLNEFELENIRQQANIDGDLYNWKIKGHQLELEGKDKFRNENVYKLRLTKANGNVFYYFISEKSYLIAGTSTIVTLAENMTESVTIFEDYKKVDSIIFPHLTTIEIAGQPVVKFIYELIEINPGIDDAKFRKP